MAFPPAVSFLLGLALLVAGAELLVRGAAGLARRFGIPPLVIGLTVVAFGTSAPELAVSLTSALAGRGDIAVGNVVGSNIFNVLFILGAAAAITPLAVSSQLVRLDVPVMIGASTLALLLALDGGYGRGAGLLLLAAGVLYVAYLIRMGRREAAARPHADGPTAAPVPRPRSPGRDRLPVQAALVLAGLALLVLGSDGLLKGAVAMATALGASPLVIGLTLVAAGTSLPEVATSLLAAARGQRDIAVGNVVGSNIFNLLFVLGGTAAVAGDVPAGGLLLARDLPVMLAVAVACAPIFFSGGVIARWEGLVLLAFYGAYTLYLVLHATGDPASRPFGAMMAFIVAPLALLTLVVVAVRQRQGRG